MVLLDQTGEKGKAIREQKGKGKYNKCFEKCNRLYNKIKYDAVPSKRIGLQS